MSPRPYRRRLRNLLLDAKLQLRVIAYAMCVGGVTAAIAGMGVWTSTAEVSRQAEHLTATRSAASLADRNVALGTLSKKVTDSEVELVHWNVAEAERLKIEKHFTDDQALAASERAQLAKAQQTMALCLLAGLALCMLVTAGAGLILTHRIAGPLYRVRLMIEEVRAGRLATLTRPLRKGDLLLEFFATFCGMLDTLRERERRELEQLDELVDCAQRGDREALTQALARLQREKRDWLGMANPGRAIATAAAVPTAAVKSESATRSTRA